MSQLRIEMKNELMKCSKGLLNGDVFIIILATVIASMLGSFVHAIIISVGLFVIRAIISKSKKNAEKLFLASVLWLLLYLFLLIVFVIDTSPGVFNAGINILIYLGLISMFYLCYQSSFVKKYSVAFGAIAVFIFLAINMSNIQSTIYKSAYDFRKAQFSEKYDKSHLAMAMGENSRMSFTAAGLSIEKSEEDDLPVLYAYKTGAYNREEVNNIGKSGLGDNITAYFYCADIVPSRDYTYNTVLAATDKKTGNLIVFCGINGNLTIPAKWNPLTQKSK